MKQSNIDTVKTLATLRGKKLGQNRSMLYFGLLMLVLVAILLVALILGVTVFQQVASTQLATNEARLGQQLIANNVRAKDGTNTVRVGTGPEGTSLVLVENLPTGNYETRIYLYEGTILEEYTVAGAPYDPNKAVSIVDSSKLDLSYNKGLLTIVTDQGVTNVALRSQQGDE